MNRMLGENIFVRAGRGGKAWEQNVDVGREGKYLSYTKAWGARRGNSVCGPAPSAIAGCGGSRAWE